MDGLSDRQADSNQQGRGVDVHVRNYDDEEHVLWVRVVTEAGDLAYQQSYRLAGHDSAIELDALTPGACDVEVELDGLRRWVERYELAADATRGLLVETGNGTVSITPHGRRIDAENGY